MPPLRRCWTTRYFPANVDPTRLCAGAPRSAIPAMVQYAPRRRFFSAALSAGSSAEADRAHPVLGQPGGSPRAHRVVRDRLVEGRVIDGDVDQELVLLADEGVERAAGLVLAAHHDRYLGAAAVLPDA